MYLNDLLSSGVIPELYTSEEQDGVVAALSTKCKRAGLSTDRASVWNFFINRVRTNLHCCLCFSPVNESFRTRAARFPALVNCTVIDWFQPWPEDALHAVGSQFLRHIDDLGGDDVRAAVEDFLPFCFSVVGKAATKIALTERRHVHNAQVIPRDGSLVFDTNAEAHEVTGRPSDCKAGWKRSKRRVSPMRFQHVKIEAQMNRRRAQPRE